MPGNRKIPEVPCNKGFRGLHPKVGLYQIPSFDIDNNGVTGFYGLHKFCICRTVKVLAALLVGENILPIHAKVIHRRPLAVIVLGQRGYSDIAVSRTQIPRSFS